MRVRRVVVLIALTGVVLVGLTTYLARSSLEAQWRIRQLQHEEADVRSGAITRLGELSSEQAIPHLIDLAREHTAHRDHVLSVCQALITRASRARHAEYVEFLIGTLREHVGSMGDPTATIDAWRHAFAELDYARDFACTSWKKLPGTAMDVAMRSLVREWESDQDAVADFVLALPDSSVSGFLMLASAASPRARAVVQFGLRGPTSRTESVSPSAVSGMAFYVAEVHPVPALRIIALYIAVTNSTRPVHGMLRSVIARDTDTGVRRAALRLLGVIGPSSDDATPQLDFTAFEGTELLADAIDARHWWSVDRPSPDPRRPISAQVDLGAGRFALPPRILRTGSTPWREDELKWLEQLLDREGNHVVRDAAASALAANRRARSREPSHGVYEWSVWKDGRAAAEDAFPAPKSGSVGWSSPPPPDMTAVSASMRFRTERTVAADLRVSFYLGRPRSTVPNASDLFWMLGLPNPLHRLSGGRGEALWLESHAAAPQLGTWAPWQLPKVVTPDAAATPPWAQYEEQESAVPSFRKAVGAGVAWTGLRVGYSAELEPPPLKLRGNWIAKRRAASSEGGRVATGPHSEAFLHYDGVVDVPSPFEVAWTSAERSTLILRPRSFLEFPSPHKNSDTSDRDYLRALILQRLDDGDVRGQLLDPVSRKGNGVEVSLDDMVLRGEQLKPALAELVELEGAEFEHWYAEWGDAILADAGTRVVARVPRWVIDAGLTIDMHPRPATLDRRALIVTDCSRLAVEKRPLSELWREFKPSESVVARERRKRGFDDVTAITGVPAPVVPAARAQAFWVDGHAALLTLHTVSSDKHYLRLRGPEWGDLTLGPFETADAFRTAQFSADGSLLTVRSGKYAIFDLKQGTRTTLWFGEQASPPKISRDGSRIAFTSWGAVFVWERGKPGLYRRGVAVSEGSVVLSGDGSLAAFLVGRDSVPSSKFAVLELDTGRLREYPLMIGAVDHHVLSADGKFAALSSRCEHDSEVYLLDLTTHRLENVTRSLDDESYPQLSADGSRLCVFRKDEALVFDRAKRTWTTALKHKGIAESAALSPDGRRLAYVESGADGAPVVQTVAIE